MHLRGSGNLCSSAVYDQGQLTLIYTHFVRLNIKLIRQAHNRLLQKQMRTLRISENINFSNDGVMKYVIRALQ